MKQEYIDLLRKDIAARLPYEPIVTNERFDGGFGHRLHLGDLSTSKYLDSLYIENTKVYLRTMSSMTEEEKLHLRLNYGFELHGNVLSNLHIIKGGGYYEREGEYVEPTEYRQYTHITIDTVSELINWLNAHHFDYRGLIEKGLAIEVTEENNPYVHRTYADMMKTKEKQQL